MNYFPQLPTAITTLKAGGLIAYPTESVWGLGCDPENTRALRRLLLLKHRHWRKGLILIAADWTQLMPYLAPLTPDMRQRIEASWPGPTTWILPCKREVSPLLRGAHASLAVRITDHPLCRTLCRHFGKALVSTSANPDGHAPAVSLRRSRSYFGRKVDFYVPGATGGLAKPSRILDGKTGAVLRS